MFHDGEKTSVEPHLCVEGWWKHPSLLFNAYKGQRAPALQDSDIPRTLYTRPHRDTHIIVIDDALFPFWSDCNNYTLYFLLIKTKLKTRKVK